MRLTRVRSEKDAVVDVLLPPPTPPPPHARPDMAAQLPGCAANLKQEDVLFWFILVIRSLKINLSK